VCLVCLDVMELPWVLMRCGSVCVVSKEYKGGRQGWSNRSDRVAFWCVGCMAVTDDCMVWAGGYGWSVLFFVVSTVGGYVW